MMYILKKRCSILVIPTEIFAADSAQLSYRRGNKFGNLAAEPEAAAALSVLEKISDPKFLTSVLKKGIYLK